MKSVIADNLTIKQNSKTILQSVNFALYKGGNMVITGPSGSGKTTLAMALAKKIYVLGRLEITFDDNNQNLSPKVLLVEQRYSLKNRGNLSAGFYYQQRFNSMDVEDCYSVREELQQLSDDTAKIEFLLTELNMQGRRDAPVIQLSSGEHKRFQLIKAFLKPTQVMVLDEPFIGLDVQSREKLYQIIDEKAAEGTTFIIISGSHHRFPDSITHVLELGKEKNYQFVPKDIFKPSYQRENLLIDILKIPFQERKDQFDNAIKMVKTIVKYGEKTILNNINWTVKRGEKWLVQGHNGAGKSTLLSLITGDNPQAYANEIYLFDKRRGRGESIWDIKKPIGFVSPEIFAYYDKNISVHDTVACGLFDTMGLYKKLSEEQETIVRQWLQVFNIEDVKAQKLNTLSSGQQRLVLLANALVKNPSVLLLDEPCQGLDEQQTNEFVEMIDELCTRIDTTLLYISHYENEIPQCIDHILHLDHGNATIKLRTAKPLPKRITNRELRREEKCEI